MTVGASAGAWMRVMILDNSLDPGLYRPVGHWGRWIDADLRTFRVPAGEFPSPRGWTHVLVTGSEASILQDDPWIVGECGLVRELAGRGVPILASRFGHQLVVRALSGKAHVRASPAPEFGWVKVTWDEEARADDPVVAGLPDPMWTYASHFDEVVDLPNTNWITLGRNERCAHAVIRWRHGPVWGFQHHPEIGVPEGASAERGRSRARDRTPGQDDRLLLRGAPGFVRHPGPGAGVPLDTRRGETFPVSFSHEGDVGPGALREGG